MNQTLQDSNAASINTAVAAQRCVTKGGDLYWNGGWDLAELKDRILYRQAIETARCFEEGVLSAAHDANVGSIYGIGFPAWTGGAMQFIDSVGTARFVKRADELAKKFGERFAPPKLLRENAAKGVALG